MNYKQAIAFAAVAAVAAVFIAVGIVQLTAPQEPLERMPDVPEPILAPSAATPSPTPSDSLSDAPLFSRQLEEARMDAEIQRKMNRELYPEGDGELPDDAEARALLWLKPHPQGYVGHLPDNFDLEGFVYEFHKCHKLLTDLVCTACYTHSTRHMMGQLSMACPLEPGEECAMLAVPVERMRNHYKVEPGFCENEFWRRRRGNE